jgi:hypothetical protein
LAHGGDVERVSLQAQSAFLCLGNIILG